MIGKTVKTIASNEMINPQNDARRGGKRARNRATPPREEAAGGGRHELRGQITDADILGERGGDGVADRGGERGVHRRSLARRLIER